MSRKCPEGCPCKRHAAQAYRRLDVEEKRKREAEYMRKYRKARAERDSEWVEQKKLKKREANRLNGRRYWLKHKFGLTVGQWDDMLIGQSGRCYLCEEPMLGVIHIDHDRSCCPGKRSCGLCIRGLADQLCNQGIGQFGDDPVKMRKVASNLEAATSRPHPGA